MGARAPALWASLGQSIEDSFPRLPSQNKRLRSPSIEVILRIELEVSKGDHVQRVVVGSIYYRAQVAHTNFQRPDCCIR
jgi:hypothetical protein